MSESKVELPLAEYLELYEAKRLADENVKKMQELTKKAFAEASIFMSLVAAEVDLQPFVEVFNKQQKHVQVELSGGRIKFSAKDSD